MRSNRGNIGSYLPEMSIYKRIMGSVRYPNPNQLDVIQVLGIRHQRCSKTCPRCLSTLKSCPNPNQAGCHTDTTEDLLKYTLSVPLWMEIFNQEPSIIATARRKFLHEVALVIYRGKKNYFPGIKEWLEVFCQFSLLAFFGCSSFIF